MTTADFRQSEPTALQIEEQIRWEVEGTERGVQRYREFIENPNVSLADTVPAKRIMGEIIRPLAQAIADAQAEARAGITAGEAGRQPDWWWLIQFTQADRLAFMTVREALTYNGKVSQGSAKRCSTTAIHLANQIQLQMEFERFKDDEKRATKEAKLRGEQRVDLFELLKSRTKKIDARAFKRWSTKIGRLREEPWSTAMCLQIGTKLLHLLVENGMGWFDVKLIPQPGGKTERYICLSAEAVQAISDLHTRAEVARPFLMPMICPPKPWQRA